MFKILTFKLQTILKFVLTVSQGGQMSFKYTKISIWSMVLMS